MESEDEDEDDLSEDEQLRSKLRDVLGNAAINMDGMFAYRAVQ